MQISGGRSYSVCKKLHNHAEILLHSLGVRRWFIISRPMMVVGCSGCWSTGYELGKGGVFGCVYGQFVPTPLGYAV